MTSNSHLSSCLEKQQTTARVVDYVFKQFYAYFHAKNRSPRDRERGRERQNINYPSRHIFSYFSISTWVEFHSFRLWFMCEMISVVGVERSALKANFFALIIYGPWKFIFIRWEKFFGEKFSVSPRRELNSQRSLTIRNTELADACKFSRQLRGKNELITGCCRWPDGDYKLDAWAETFWQLLL